MAKVLTSMTTDFPGMRTPSFSAWRTIAFAIRSLVDPPMERKSTLATEGEKGKDGRESGQQVFLEKWKGHRGNESESKTSRRVW